LLPGYDELLHWKAAIPVGGGRAQEQIGKWIVRLYEAWGKPEKAAEWRGRMAATPIRQACSTS